MGDNIIIQKNSMHDEKSDSLTDQFLLEEAAQGSEEAAKNIYNRYAWRLRQLAKKQCSKDLKQHVEVEDIVQSVFGSFFRAAKSGYYDLPDGEELWNLFLVIALNKIRAKGNYHKAAKRDARRSSGGEWFDNALEYAAAGMESARGILEITVEDLLEKLPPQHRAALKWRMEGFNVHEMSQKMGRSKRSMERLLQEARSKLAEVLKEDQKEDSNG